MKPRKSKPNRKRHAAALTATAFLSVVPFGCTSTQTIRANHHAGNLNDAWQPRPTGLRIYPAIRFVMEDQTPLLECRIELLDAMGDNVKASGTVKCELFASTGQGDGVLGERLYGWDITIENLDDQKAFYDPVIRGYLFRLKLANIEPARRNTTLRIIFTPAEGAVLMDEAEILPNDSPRS